MLGESQDAYEFPGNRRKYIILSLYTHVLNPNNSNIYLHYTSTTIQHFPEGHIIYNLYKNRKNY